MAKINFSISTSQGRITVEPESSSVHQSTYEFRIGGATAVTKTFTDICFCKMFKLARGHDGHDVLSWMQKYVDLALDPESHTRQTDYSFLLDLPHCWTCAGRNVI
jgi:hypothetical protein